MQSIALYLELKTMRKLLLLLLLVLPVMQGCIPLIIGGAVGAGALLVTDRRPSGAYVKDERIEIAAIKAINDRYRNNSNINVTSYNGNVLISGEAGDEKVKADAEAIVRTIDGVKNVFNEVNVAGNSSLGSRSNDTAITSKVKTRFLSNGGRFSPNHIKVVTENSVVYLMGIVSKPEADAASEVASTTTGVQRVVKLFEYKS
jgi:osmotically-inducible protein OsmY